MHKLMALVAALLLCLAATPALAGPQNGEVNHYGQHGQEHHPCVGQVPERQNDRVFDELLELFEAWFATLPCLKMWGVGGP